MSAEISFATTLMVNKADASVSAQMQSQLDMAGTHMLQTVLTAPTTAAAIPFGSISGAPKKLLIKNLGATVITVAGDSGLTNFPQTIQPNGDFLLLAPGSATVYWKATTTASDALVIACEA